MTTVPRWTLGSMLFLVSFAVMMGPWAYFRHLVSAERLPFTGIYFGSIGLTLYFSLGVSHRELGRASRSSPSWTASADLSLALQLHSTILTLISAIIQLVCLAWYLVSYFPMGASGLRLASSFGARRAAAWMTG
jgi:hypothetical protein